MVRPTIQTQVTATDTRSTRQLLPRTHSLFDDSWEARKSAWLNWATTTSSCAPSFSMTIYITCAETCHQADMASDVLTCVALTSFHCSLSLSRQRQHIWFKLRFKAGTWWVARTKAAFWFEMVPARPRSSSLAVVELGSGS